MKFARPGPSTSGSKDECCSTRALWGWSPPSLPADSARKQWVDRVLPRTGIHALVYYAAVVALLVLAPRVSGRAELVVDGLAALAGGGWCSVNFWRCRQAHCLVTGVGWLGLSALAFGEAAVGHSLIGGNEQLVFLGALVVGLGFEGAWQLLRGTNALMLPSRN